MDETWFTKTRIYRWIGGGFLAFCILSVLMMAGPIARDAERRALENLKVAGFGWAEVERYGRGVAVKGMAPTEAEGRRAVEVAGDDWSVRDAWGEYEVAPAAPPGKQGAVQQDRPVIAAANAPQILVQFKTRGVAQ